MTDATSGLLTPGTLDLFSQKTRDKILAASLVLFNQRGFGAVTTASIAEQAGIWKAPCGTTSGPKKTSCRPTSPCLQTVFAQENTKADSGDPGNHHRRHLPVVRCDLGLPVLAAGRLQRCCLNPEASTTCSSPSKVSTTFSTSGHIFTEGRMNFTRPTMACLVAMFDKDDSGAVGR